jgi:hypothetical protein
MNYKLRCTEFNDVHVKFTLFDRTGANCGQVTVSRSDVYYFLDRGAWQGDVDWNSKNLDNNARIAQYFIDRQEAKR